MRTPNPASERELRAYASSLAHIRSAELKKPEAERDTALIEECERTELYCAQRLAELEPEAKAWRGIGKKPLRFIAAAAAVLAALAAVSVISYASGRKKLSEDVQWSVRYGRLDHYGHTVEEDPVPRDEYSAVSFASEEELKAAFGSELLLPGQFEGVYFVSAEAAGVPGNSLIHCEYRVNKKKLVLEIDTLDKAGDRIGSEVNVYHDGSYEIYNTSNLLIGEGADCSFAYFSKGPAHYILTGSQGTEIVADIAHRLMLLGRGS